MDKAGGADKVESGRVKESRGAEKEQGGDHQRPDRRTEEGKARELTESPAKHPAEIVRTIGEEGQNARLAAKLTGAKIDIQPDSILED